MDLSPIRCLKPVAPILCFGQQVAVAIWNLTWDLGPFGIQTLPLTWMYPLNLNLKETWSTQGQMYSVENGLITRLTRQRHARALTLRFQATKKETRSTEKIISLSSHVPEAKPACALQCRLLRLACAA
jgi:hypothetical protein